MLVLLVIPFMGQTTLCLQGFCSVAIQAGTGEFIWQRRHPAVPKANRLLRLSWSQHCGVKLMSSCKMLPAFPSGSRLLLKVKCLY